MKRLHRRGAAALEFALCFPAFLVVVGASVDLGRLLSSHHTVQRLARDAARVGGAVTTTDDHHAAGETEIEAGALAYAEAALNEAYPTCEDACHANVNYFLDANGNAYLTVDVSTPFQPVFGLLTWMPTTLTDTFTVMTELQS